MEEDDTTREPGIKFDGGKLRYELIPFAALEQAVAILTFGAEKYGANNWQNIPDGADRYLGSMLRHAAAHAKGELLDQDSGLPHIAHVITCGLFILHFLDDQLPDVSVIDLSHVAEKYVGRRNDYLKLLKSRGETLSSDDARIRDEPPRRPCSMCGRIHVQRQSDPPFECADCEAQIARESA